MESRIRPRLSSRPATFPLNSVCYLLHLNPTCFYDIHRTASVEEITFCSDMAQKPLGAGLSVLVVHVPGLVKSIMVMGHYPRNRWMPTRRGLIK